MIDPQDSRRTAALSEKASGATYAPFSEEVEIHAANPMGRAITESMLTRN